MAKRWIETAVIGACLALATGVQAQGWPGYGEATPSGGQWTPGPMPTRMAPPGPSPDLALPADTPNAFDPDCRSRADYCCNGMWFSAEGLAWVLKDQRAPAALITTGGTGVLGAAGTSIFLDGDQLDYDYFAGARASAGFWLNADRTISIEGSGFVLEKKGTSRSAFTPVGGAAIFIPFIGPGGVEAAQAFGGGGNAGQIDVLASSRLWGAESNIVCLGSCCGCDIAFFTGFRYLDLMENFDITGQILLAAGGAQIIADQFQSRNQFYGGQVGFRLGTLTAGGIFIGAQAKASAGNNHSTIIIDGQNANVLAAGAPAFFPGGLFARQSNSGRFNENDFSWIGEAQVKIGYLISRYLTVFAGYDYLYWDHVFRPGDQIDRNTTAVVAVGVAQPAGPPPVLPNRPSHFWAQGINGGFELRW